MQSLVQGLYSKQPIATVWHPDAKGEVVNTPWGNIRVLVGDAAYQLTTGEMVKV